MPESDGSIPADCDGDTEGKPLLLPRLPELLVLLVPDSPLLVPLPPTSGVDAPTTAHGDGDREATPLLPPLLQSCHRGCWCCQCHYPGGGGEGPDRAQRQTVVRKRLQRRGPLQRRKQAALHPLHRSVEPVVELLQVRCREGLGVRVHLRLEGRHRLRHNLRRAVGRELQDCHNVCDQRGDLG